MTEQDYMDANIDEILRNAAVLRERMESTRNLSQVTIAKAAETDRLTDENRRLQARVEEDAHTIDSLHGALDDTRKELSATIDSKGAAVRAVILSNEQNHRLVADLAKRDSEISRLKFTIDNLHHELANRPGRDVSAAKETPSPDYVTRSQLIEAIGEAANSADAGVRHALRLILDGLVYP
jgi:hypothetical protein